LIRKSSFGLSGGAGGGYVPSFGSTTQPPRAGGPLGGGTPIVILMIANN